MERHRSNPPLRVLSICAAAAALTAAYEIGARPGVPDLARVLDAARAPFGDRFGLFAFLAASLLVATRAAGFADPIPLGRWPAMFLAGAFVLGLPTRLPETLARIGREFRERFAPPGTGESAFSLPDHYRFLEALAPRVTPEDRILVVSDSYPTYPDLAYWFLPPRPGGPVVERLNPRVDRLAAYLQGTGSDWDRDAALRGVRDELRREGVLYEESELGGLVENTDVLIALDTALDLRAAAAEAGLAAPLLEWSPRKYALRRPGRSR